MISVCAGIVRAYAYRSSQKVSIFCPILTKIEMTWFFFYKIQICGAGGNGLKLYPQNISPLIYTIGENRRKLCLQDM